MTGGWLVIDVDGVLNPYSDRSRPVGYNKHRLTPRGGLTYTVWLCPGHGRLLLDLAEATGWGLVWATTWEHDANRLIGPRVGLPELPVIEFGGHPGTLRGWKFPAVQDYAGQAPLVWFDDDFRKPYWDWVHALSEFRAARGDTPTLLHHVDPDVGLTGQDITTVRDWIGDLL